jgi:hypothetical protein
MTTVVASFDLSIPVRSRFRLDAVTLTEAPWSPGSGARAGGSRWSPSGEKQ